MAVPKNPARKYGETDHAAWVKAYVGGESQSSIARRLGVSPVTISSVLAKHVPKHAAVVEKRLARRQTLALDERHMARACREVFGVHAVESGGQAEDSPRMLRQFSLARCILLDLKPEDLREAYALARIARRHDAARVGDMGGSV